MLPAAAAAAVFRRPTRRDIFVYLAIIGKPGFYYSYYFYYFPN